jgi:phosphoribosyl-AMP cyclohydrolase
MSATATNSLPSLKFDANGMIPAVVQDAATKQVLMVAWMNEAAVRLTIETKKAHYYSRSRNKMWLKGEESGHVQLVKSLRTDCDKDVILLEVEQVGGAACHDGYESCFYRKLDTPGTDWQVDGRKVFDPATVYRKK